MRITVDEDRCIGAGQCVLAAPEVFDQRDSDGIALVLQDDPGPGLHEVSRQAAHLCPALAIAVTEDTTA